MATETAGTVITLPTSVKGHYKSECRAWRRDVRRALYLYYHRGGVTKVSDNEVYELIFIKKKVPPPPLRPDSERVGLARSPVFTECEGGLDRYYAPTTRMIHSNDPSAKRRRIRVFRYLPEEDKRVQPKSGARTRNGDWAGADDF